MAWTIIKPKEPLPDGSWIGLNKFVDECFEAQVIKAQIDGEFVEQPYNKRGDWTNPSDGIPFSDEELNRQQAAFDIAFQDESTRVDLISERLSLERAQCYRAARLARAHQV